MNRWAVMVESWQLECCGPAFCVDDEVAWTLLIMSAEEAAVPSELLADLDGEVAPLAERDVRECPHSTVLRAGGVTASWCAPHPSTGRASVRGLLVEDHHGYAPWSLPLTVGEIRRIQVMTQGYEHDAQDRVWRPVAEALSLREVDRSPRRFEDGVYHSGGLRWSERGLLVELPVRSG